MTWLRSNWLKDVVLPLLLATLRACWLWTWLEIARSGLAPSVTTQLLPLPVLALVSLAGLFTARRLLSSSLNLRAARLLEAALGMAVITLLIWWRFYSDEAPWNLQWLRALGVSLVSWESELPGPLILVPFLIYSWLRGVLDGRAHLYRDDVWNAFAVGFVALAVAGVVALSGQRGLPPGTYLAAFLFFGSGLAAIALASLESTRSMATRRGDDQLTFNRYWFISVASIIIALLIIGFVLSALITPQAVAQMLQWTSIILDVLGLILYYLFLIFAFIVFLVLGPLITLMRRLLAGSASEAAQPIQMPDFQKQLEGLEKGNAAVLPSAISRLLPWLGLAVVIFVIGLIFAIALRRLYAGKEEEIIETRESILSASLLMEQLGGLRQRLRRSRPRFANPFFSLDGEQEARRIIRAAYQDLLAAARRLGQPHRRDQTPTEYGNALKQTWPGEESPLTTLTAAYLKARYAAQPPSSDEAQAAWQAWEKVRASVIPPGNGKAKPANKRKT
jgi:hypothetical protein